ncbi:MAG: L-seryl-tRNA(Sec) selenium transferase [Terriglobia bacterium]
MDEISQKVFRQIPSMDRLLEHPETLALIGQTSRSFVAGQLRHLLDKFRQDLADAIGEDWSQPRMIESILLSLKVSILRATSPRFRRVINATGVILHTNLGRAPLSRAGVERLRETSAHYSNLEYDLKTGKRGKRDQLIDHLLQDFLGCEQSLVVNNGASAVFLALNSLAEGGEVLISRGELIEIGDGFRIPDILSKSGAFLNEVGTTNKTEISDYRNAVTDRTRLILRVHQSNFRMIGFTARPGLEDLLALSREKGIPLLEDQGSGCLTDPASLGLGQEPSPKDSLGLGVPLVCFSGDKLLGGPQAGIITGKAAWVSQLRRNPLFRAIRVDKLTLTVLESTLISYLKGREHEEIPVLQLIRTPVEALQKRGEVILGYLGSKGTDWKIEIVDGVSRIGGGSAPEAELATKLIAIRSSCHSTDQLESELRQANPPVIARVEDDQLILDLRTVFPEEDQELAAALTCLVQSGRSKARKNIQ